VLPIRVNRKAPASGPTSEAAASIAATDTTGAEAASWIVTVPKLEGPIVYAVLASMARTTVSSPSVTASGIGVTVIIFAIVFAGIVTGNDEPPIAL
jgi:hypothetical protein